MPSAPGSRCRTSSNGTLGRSRLGSPDGDVAHDGHALSREIGGPRQGDGTDDDEGLPAGGDDASEQQQQGERGHADQHGEPTRFADLRHHLPELRQRVGVLDRDAEQLRELPDDEDDRNAVDVAHEHGAREVVGEPADLEHPCEHEAGSDEEPEHRRQRDRIGTAGDDDRQDRRSHQCGHRPSGPTINCRDGAEQQVGNGWEQQGVQPVHRRHAGDLGERHRRRHGERGDGDAGEQVPLRRAWSVGAEVRRDRHRPMEQRLLSPRAEYRLVAVRPRGHGGTVVVSRSCSAWASHVGMTFAGGVWAEAFGPEPPPVVSPRRRSRCAGRGASTRSSRPTHAAARGRCARACARRRCTGSRPRPTRTPSPSGHSTAWTPSTRRVVVPAGAPRRKHQCTSTPSPVRQRRAVFFGNRPRRSP